MSTDIVHFTSEREDHIRIYESQALQLYFEISMPLMVLTFIVWYAVYRWERRNEKQRGRQVSLRPVV